MRKASSSYSPQPSPKFKAIGSPLLEKLDKVSIHTPRNWVKWILIVKFISKMMAVSPNVLKKEHLLLIDDKANIIPNKCVLFNPYTPVVLWTRYFFLMCIMIGLLVVFWEMTFSDSKVFLLAFCNYKLLIKLDSQLLRVPVITLLEYISMKCTQWKYTK